MKKIILDAGHGGSDPGAVGPTGLLEKDVAWKITCMVADILMRYDIEIIFTRVGDTKVSLDKRVQMANESKADYFISIHINSAANPNATGTETFAYKQGAEGDRLAHSIQSNLVGSIGLADRGVKYNNYQVLRDTKMPAALPEIAFINNPSEEAMLKQDEFIERAAVGIAKGILEHLKIDYIPIPNEAQLEDVSEFAKEARAWVKENGISDGSRPSDPVTREESWTMLYRYDKLNRK